MQDARNSPRTVEDPVGRAMGLLAARWGKNKG